MGYRAGSPTVFASCSGAAGEPYLASDSSISMRHDLQLGRLHMLPELLPLIRPMTDFSGKTMNIIKNVAMDVFECSHELRKVHLNQLRAEWLEAAKEPGWDDAQAAEWANSLGARSESVFVVNETGGAARDGRA